MRRAASCWSRQGQRGDPADLRQVITTTTDPATACSIALTLAEALAVLHQDQFRGGLSLSWSDCVRAVRLENGTWHLALFPPIPAHIILAERPAGFAGVARFGAPELFATAATLPTPASDSFSLGALLFELLTGKPAIQPGSLRELVADLLDGRFRRVADFRPDLPGDLGGIRFAGPGTRARLAAFARRVVSRDAELRRPAPVATPAARGSGIPTVPGRPGRGAQPGEPQGHPGRRLSPGDAQPSCDRRFRRRPG